MKFLTVLLNNMKCAFCRIKNCSLRYQPNREKVFIYEGNKYRKSCPKVKMKRWRKIMK